MSDIPKFEDTEEVINAPKFDDTEPVAFDDTMPIEEPKDVGPQKLSDEDIKGKFKLYDEVKNAPENFKDFMDSVSHNIGLAGVAEKGAAAAKAGVDQLRGSDKAFGEDYDKWIVAQDKEHTDREKRSPHLSKGGNLLGAAVTPTPGNNVITRIIGNMGLSAADAATKENSVKEAVAKAKEAGVTTGLFQVALEALGPVGKAIKSFANNRAVKSLDPILSQQELLNNKGMKDKLGAELLEQNITRFGSNTADQAPRVAGMLEGKGKAIGAIRDSADNAGAQVDLSRLEKIGDSKVGFSGATNKAEQKAALEYADNAKNLASVPNRTIKQTQEEILSLDKNIPFDKAVQSQGGVLTPKQQAYKDLRGDLVSQVDGKIKEFAPDDFQRYLDLKKEYGMFKDADKILDKSVARAERNADFGLRDLLMANAATKKGGIEGGLTQIAAAGATKFARERGNSMLAVSADTIAKMLGENPAGFGKYAKPLIDAAKRGNSALMATHALMSKDPQYQELFNQQEGSVP